MLDNADLAAEIEQKIMAQIQGGAEGADEASADDDAAE